MERQNVLIWVIVALFIAFGCGCITEENMSAEKIAVKMVEKQKGIHDMSHTEILTMYIGNESRTTELDILYKKQNMFKRIEKVNSSRVHYAFLTG
jgi:outer membrane lipoprotein-sorting protein